MKISVITRHAISNYGSFLQTLATQKILEQLGHTSEIVDYVRADEEYHQVEKTLLKQKPNWSGNFLKRAVYLALRQPESILAGKKFESQRERLMNLTRRYSSYEDLQRNPPKADAYMTGSDQVWGPVSDGKVDDSYCLSFVPENSRKFAYAASFGKTKFSEDTYELFYKYLSKYEKIAVREDSAVDLLSKLNLSSVQVLDPTLLLSQEEWKPYIGKRPAENYILIYQLHNNPDLGKYAQRLAKERGMKLIRISASLHQFAREGSFRYLPDISQFLAYIKYADCMVTDSFHGTAFALNFNTPFVEFLPENNTASRNQSILKLTGLTSRIVSDPSDSRVAAENINFQSVNQILATHRAESIEILRQMLSE